MSTPTSPSDAVHMAFFPLMSPGHFIPMVDMARIFASRGVTSTIITTPANAANIRQLPNAHLNIVTIPFPPPELTGLNPGQENLATVTTAQFGTFVSSLSHFETPFRAILTALDPDCLVSDSLFPWTVDLALELDIPRLTFHGCGAFPLVCIGEIFKYLPFPDESFALTDLPHKITVNKNGLPDLFTHLEMLQVMAVAEAKSYGVVVNTYYEMEPVYVDLLKGKATKPTWCVGPVSLCNRLPDDKAARGEAPVERSSILSWLDSKPENSVAYVCFGSLCHINAAQLKEIALGLEASGKNFLWVVRKEPEGDSAKEDDWMREGFEKRVSGRGLIVRGWCPQTLVLSHPALGWFVTHCGWNSLQEAACAGVPVVTWPLFHEQFINQELLVEVMGIGVRMWEGFRKNALAGDEAAVKADEIAAVIGKVLSGGEEMEVMRKKAKEFGEAAVKTLEEGGSTYNDMTNLIEELKAGRKKN